MQGRRYHDAKPLELGPIVAERQFPLFKQDGTKMFITLRIGKPFIVPELGFYRCPLQILGAGKERVAGAWGEDPFVALQYTMDLAGKMLDDLVKRENLETRFRPSEPHQLSGVTWIWRYPVSDFEI